MKSNRVIYGDCRESMRAMIADGVKVQMVCTSPPYWGLRDYGTATWEGGSAECDHKAPHDAGISENKGNGTTHPGRFIDCKCGASRIDQQLGLEPTMQAYVANMVEVFGLVWELLADDGVVFCNLGDSYFPGKQLAGIPWRVAFALQEAGWYLRQELIWSKPSPMPESVRDRCTKSHEQIFLLSKRGRYFFDAEAIKEPAAQDEFRPSFRGGAYLNGATFDNAAGGKSSDVGNVRVIGATRNKRSVWTVASQPFSDAHFAVFPEALIEPMILAGTSQRGHCPACLARWVRVVDKEFIGRNGDVLPQRSGIRSSKLETLGLSRGSGSVNQPGHVRAETIGWNPSCQCGLEPVPDIVCDPFMGSGTTARVAEKLGRWWIGCELQRDYEAMQKARTAQMGLVLL